MNGCEVLSSVRRIFVFMAIGVEVFFAEAGVAEAGVVVSFRFLCMLLIYPFQLQTIVLVVSWILTEAIPRFALSLFVDAISIFPISFLSIVIP